MFWLLSAALAQEGTVQLYHPPAGRAGDLVLVVHFDERSEAQALRALDEADERGLVEVRKRFGMLFQGSALFDLPSGYAVASMIPRRGFLEDLWVQTEAGLGALFAAVRSALRRLLGGQTGASLGHTRPVRQSTGGPSSKTGTSRTSGPIGTSGRTGTSGFTGTSGETGRSGPTGASR